MDIEEPPRTPFEHCAKRARTGPSPKNRHSEPRQWVRSEECMSINKKYSYAEYYGGTETTHFRWQCPEEMCGAIFTLYPTSKTARIVTGVAECCHHAGGVVRESIPHQCDKCWTERKPCGQLPGFSYGGVIGRK